MGGGYGTGREIVEFFSQYGGRQGLMGIAVATAVFAIVLGLTFDLARRAQAYEYREFFRHLIGPFWWTFEVLYLLLFLLVLGVLGSAASNLLTYQFDVPSSLGLILMLVAVALAVFFGRQILERILTGWMFLMYGVFLLYFVFMLQRFDSDLLWASISTDGPAIASDPALVSLEAVKGGLLYALYNVALAPVLLFSARGIETRQEALGCGLVTAILMMLPAAMFHISFAAGAPGVLDEAVPVYWMIEHYAPSWMLFVYLVALLGTLAQTGAGLVQGVIERVEAVLTPNKDDGMAHWLRALIAVVSLSLSAGLASLGIISLIAKGYSAMGVGFAIVYVLPLLLVGFRKRWQTKQ